MIFLSCAVKYANVFACGQGSACHGVAMFGKGAGKAGVAVAVGLQFVTFNARVVFVVVVGY